MADTREDSVTDLRPGLEGTAALTVKEAHTAPRIGSGKVHVLATPVMINLMEAAALAAVEDLLPEGRQSLGTRIDVSHVAATPIGMLVRATAVVTHIEDNRITFRVAAHDEQELIGEGTHERVVVDMERFDSRVRRKLPPGS